MPNNRQLATILWAGLLLIWLISRKDSRGSVIAAIRTATSPKLLIPLSVLVVWVLGLIYAASTVDVWHRDRITDTAFWFVTVGLVLFGGFEKVSKEGGFVHRRALAALEFSVFIEVLSEVFVLNIVAELVLQPVLALLGGMSVMVAQKREQRNAKRVVDLMILLCSAGLLLHAVLGVQNNWGSLDKSDLLQQLALPVWLTIGILPYIYLVGLLAAYELAFVRIDWKSDADWRTRSKLKLALVTGFHVKAAALGRFTADWQFKLAAARSFGEARRVIRHFRHGQRVEAKQSEEKAARLTKYAGVEGVDADGRRLDRREFAETKEALRWIATCQMGWYRNERVGRYRADLLAFVLETIVGKSLPPAHGIEMRVSEDGERWFAWRHTVTGWVFAIGAAGPPPDQWEYDGPEPPQGFPGEDPAWGPAPYEMDTNLNW